jgi:hypothetical protein
MRMLSEYDAAHGDYYHGLQDVDTSLVITQEASPPDHPAGGVLDDPTARQRLEALLIV